jgi:NTP pyrophosphatase (non-canonical NTP hydrolase)
MSDPNYFQDGFEKRLSHAIEECGEFLAAAGKLQRWGPKSVNPEIPPYARVTNLNWLRSEMQDVTEALARLDEAIREEFPDG